MAVRAAGKKFGEIKAAVKEEAARCEAKPGTYQGLKDIETILPAGMKSTVNAKGEMLLEKDDRSVCITVYEDEFVKEGTTIGDLVDTIEAADGNNFAATTANVYGDFLWTGVVYQGGAKSYKGLMGRFFSVEPNDEKTFAMVTIFDDTQKFNLLDFMQNGIVLKWKAPKSPKEDA